MLVTLYKNTFGLKLKDLPLSEVLRDIQNGVWFKDVFELRKIRAKSSKKYDKEKVKLMAFTPCATFKISYGLKNNKKVLRPPTKADLIQYNQLIIVDFDKLDEFDIHEVWQKVYRDKYTLAAFSSPSGAGLKIFVRVNSELEQHMEAFKAVNEYYTKLVANRNVSYDKSGSNVNRLCYISSDANLTYNPKAKVFPVQTSLFEPPKTKETKKTKDVNKDSPPSYSVTKDKAATSNEVVANFLKVGAKLERDGRNFVEGQRHEYVKHFAINAVKYGILENDCLNYCLDNFPLDNGEVNRLVDWAYANISEVGIYAKHQQKRALTLVKQEKKEEPQYKAELFKEQFDLIESHSEAHPEYMSSEEIEKITADDSTQKAIKRMLVIEKSLRETYDFRKNIMLNLYEYKGKRSQKYTSLEADEYNSIYRGLLFRGVKSSPAEIKKILESEFSPKKHPLRELFMEWGELAEDGTDYIQEVAAMVKTDAPKGLWATVFKKWCVASVANAFVDGACTNRCCLILTGAQQTGKSKFFKMLWDTKHPNTFIVVRLILIIEIVLQGSLILLLWKLMNSSLRWRNKVNGSCLKVW